jgi:hypothetical protein
LLMADDSCAMTEAVIVLQGPVPTERSSFTFRPQKTFGFILLLMWACGSLLPTNHCPHLDLGLSALHKPC